MQRKKIEHWQVIMALLIAYDMVAINLSYFLALWLRFDCAFSRIPKYYLVPWFNFIPIYAFICMAVFVYLRMYNSLWRFASFTELHRAILSTIITGSLHTLLITVIFRRMPITYYVFGAVIQFILTVGVRFFYRFVLLLREAKRKGGDASSVMLIGAGNAGQMILRDIRQAKETKEKVVCIVDDNPNKWGRTLDGVPIVGGRDSILKNAEKYGVQKIYLALPSATAEEKRDILAVCQETGCELKSLPGMYQLVSGDVTVSQMKSVSVEDLLGREPIAPDLKEVFDFINGKVVLVTGGGGSIGSELCRQIAAHHPQQLIIFDVYTHNIINLSETENLVTVMWANEMFDPNKPDTFFEKV